ncbi:hypothetical protein [Halococcus agarilyticus]|uniref:hypothetical protein n=1 Tax=Halococcus agarilyticus TaxID=1232219 RepID=UPI000677C385|nr:hypothetical protein [Halococcus agarilyticus]
MSRDNEIATYVSDETKAELDRRAEVEGISRSQYLNDLIHREFQRDEQERAASELRAEQRIRALMNEAADEIRQASEEMREMNAKAGAYAAANFELLKRDHTDGVRRDALETGSRRLRQDLDDTHADLDGVAENADADRESSGSDDDESLVDELRGEE